MEEKKNEVQVMEGIFTIYSADGQPRLIGSRCNNCKKKCFPKRRICPNCFSDEVMDEVLLNPQGKIYAFTIVRIPPPLGFEVPYAYGYVDLIEEDLRVPTMFIGGKLEQLRIGMDVILVIDKLRTDKEGNEIIGYKFKLIEG